jgi:hypothetical protein
MDALAKAGDGADALVVLGDLINFVDYHDHSGGILGSVFGPTAVDRFAQLRCGGVPGVATAYVRELWAQLPDSREVVRQAVIRRDRPRAALFGHVHQPLAQRVRVGRTECVNVGHFQRTGVPYVVRY